VAVFLASSALRDVLLVYPGRFYLNNLVLESRYIIYVFVTACWFQVDEKLVEGCFCNSMMNVYYIANRVSQFEQFLAYILHVCGVVEVFEDYSVGPLFLKLVCVVIYSTFFEMFDEVAVRIRRLAVEFDDIV
jgi:hypothetical protein